MDVFIAPSGRVYLDLIFTGLTRIPKPGEELFARDFAFMVGGSFNVARALHRLHVDAHLVADLGKDLPSKFINEIWLASGVPTTFLRNHPQAVAAVTCAFSVKSDRAFFSYIDPLPSSKIDAALLSQYDVRHLVCPGLPHDESLLPLLTEAKRKRIPVYMDCQYTEKGIEDPFLEKHVRLTDYFFVNELEAKTLSSEDNLESAALKLSRYAPHAIVKLGAEGALLAANGRITRQNAPRIELVDTTGAGDCFFAGFVYAKVKGSDDTAALRHAVGAGSLSCEGIGGEAAPEESLLLRFLDSPRMP